jgi:hypothetical protein
MHYVLRSLYARAREYLGLLESRYDREFGLVTLPPTRHDGWKTGEGTCSDTSERLRSSFRLGL